MRMTQESFFQGLELLSSVYGDDHAVFKNPDISEIWYNFFAAKYSDRKFMQMVKHYLAVCHWFPKVPNDICKVWDDSGNDRPPGENWQAMQEQAYRSLPSSEAQAKIKEQEELKSISLEQMAENRKRLKMVYAIASEMKALNTEEKQRKIDYLTKAPIHELEAIAQTCHKAKQLSVVANRLGELTATPDAVFEDMRKYFHSGSDKYRQVAINWASDPTNGCRLVRHGGRVVDIEQVDF